MRASIRLSTIVLALAMAPPAWGCTQRYRVGPDSARTAPRSLFRRMMTTIKRD
jgi:hypothetical protein